MSAESEHSAEARRLRGVVSVLLAVLNGMAACGDCRGDGVRRPSDRQCVRCSGSGIEISGKLHWRDVASAIAKAEGES